MKYKLGLIKILGVYLSKNQFESGNIQSSRWKRAQRSCTKLKTLIDRREQEQGLYQKCGKKVSLLLQGYFLYVVGRGLAGILLN